MSIFFALTHPSGGVWDMDTILKQFVSSLIVHKDIYLWAVSRIFANRQTAHEIVCEKIQLLNRFNYSIIVFTLHFKYY